MDVKILIAAPLMWQDLLPLPRFSSKVSGSL